METKIQPVTIFPDTGTTLRVSGVQVRQLGSGGNAVAMWEILGEGSSDDKRQLKTGVVFLSESEYDAWGNDDSYVLELVVQKLGLVRDE